MKKHILFLILTFLFVTISCKKNDVQNLDQNPVQTDTLYPTGLILSTPDELATVKSITTLDTSQIRVFDSYNKSADLIQNVIGIEDELPDANQQQFGSCQSWALGYYLMSYYYRKIENYPNLILSPSFIYNQTASFPPLGVSFVKVLEFAKEKGTCVWNLMPGNPTNYENKPDPEAKKNAKNFIIGDYFKILEAGQNEPDQKMIKTFLRRKMPILIGLKIDHAWDPNNEINYKDNSDYIKTSDGSYLWKNMDNYETGILIPDYHAVIVCGYSNLNNAFLIKNSWGKDWGQNGYMWVDYDVFKVVVKEAYLAAPRFVKTKHIDDGKMDVNASGDVKTYGFFQIKANGFCYSTEENPTLEDPNDLNVEISANGEGPINLQLKELKPNKTYYIRAYSKSNSQTYYGNEESFTTADATLPSVSTTNVESITQTSAVSGGTVSNDGGDSITARGVIWSTSANPTLLNVVNNNITSDGTGTGSYVSNLTGLSEKITYYVRAYATNSVGTSYGNEISFTTKSDTSSNKSKEVGTWELIETGYGKIPALYAMTKSKRDETDPNTDFYKYEHYFTNGYIEFKEDGTLFGMVTGYDIDYYNDPPDRYDNRKNYYGFYDATSKTYLPAPYTITWTDDNNATVEYSISTGVVIFKIYTENGVLKMSNGTISAGNKNFMTIWIKKE